MKLNLKIWRQTGPAATGRLESYAAHDISTDMSFLEMLDVVNEDLIAVEREPIAFEHDCREGICGQCGLMINGVAHGPERATTTCQLHLRKFKDGDTITVEPWRARAFPVIKDLVVDRGAFDRIIEAGGYISAPTGSAPNANAILVPKQDSDRAFDAAMKDPELIQNAEKQGLVINPVNGGDVEKLLVQFANYPPNIIARARAAIER